MAMPRPVTAINFSNKKDPELITRLNAVAPFCYIKVHTLAKKILMENLDQMVERFGIDLNLYEAQSARAG